MRFPFFFYSYLITCVFRRIALSQMELFPSDSSQGCLMAVYGGIDQAVWSAECRRLMIWCLWDHPWLRMYTQVSGNISMYVLSDVRATGLFILRSNSQNIINFKKKFVIEYRLIANPFLFFSQLETMFQMCSSNRAWHYLCVCSVLEKSFAYWRLWSSSMPNLF